MTAALLAYGVCVTSALVVLIWATKGAPDPIEIAGLKAEIQALRRERDLSDAVAEAFIAAAMKIDGERK